ncbi:MAG: ABC transporter substrate-binding protein [Actinomycetota bacterium]
MTEIRPGGSGVAQAPAPAGTFAAAPLRRVRVALPSRNPQFLAFWVALASGMFTAAGLQLDLTLAPEQLGAPVALCTGQADIALLPPPLYLRLIAGRQPVVCFANLLRNDPVNVVLTEGAAARVGMVPGLPTAEAIRRLEGLRLGLAPGPTRRLRALGAWAGSDPAAIEIVTLPGPEQNPAFGGGAVDGLYAHTPHLERALVDDLGCLAVHASRGDIPPTSVAQIHAAVASRDFAREAPEAIDALVGCLALAMEVLGDADPRAAEALVTWGFPGLNRVHLDRTLEVYRPAIPPSPQVTPKGLREADVFSGGAAGIDRLSEDDLAPFIWSDAWPG